MATPAAEAAIRKMADAGGGRVTEEQVVEAARDKRSPLHDEIWRDDDATAAYAHRLQLARELIRSIKLEVVVSDRRFVAPAFVRDPRRDVKPPGYFETLALRTDEDLARDTVIAEFVRASQALIRARAVAAALGVAEDLTSLVQDLSALQQRVAQQRPGQSDARG